MAYPFNKKLDLAEARASDYQPRNVVLNLDDIMRLSSAEWLVKGLIPANGVSVIYGRPGAGKTFFGLAMALSVAHGLSCFGRRTQQGNVAFVVGEGTSGFQRRVRAWHQHNGRDWRGFGAVQVVPHPINMLDLNAVRGLILDLAHRFGGTAPRMVVIDTLARCFGDGDENRQPDMARFVEACELIRQVFSCAVCVIHHTPKDSDELRGSSALEGAAECVLRISKADGMEAFVRKMKDGKDNFTLGFRMESVDLGVDEDGDAILTPVAVLEGPTRDGEPASGSATPSGKNKNGVLDILTAAGDVGLTDAEWREASKSSGVIGGQNPNRAFRDARDALVKNGVVLAEGDRFVVL